MTVQWMSGRGVVTRNKRGRRCAGTIIGKNEVVGGPGSTLTSWEARRLFRSDPSKGSCSPSSIIIGLSTQQETPRIALVHSQVSEVGGNICLPEG